VTYDPARNPFADPAIPTMANLLDIILAHEAIDLRQRREIASAIRVLEHWFNRPLAAMPASADYLRRRFEGFHHEHAGIGHKRVQNVRSLLLKALKLSGLWRDNLDERRATIWMRTWCRGGDDDRGNDYRAQESLLV